MKLFTLCKSLFANLDRKRHLSFLQLPFVALFLLSTILLSACSADWLTENINSNETSSPLTSFTDVADYIRKHETLPDNFITKDEARKLGWEAQKQNLHLVAPGKSIGGDRFGNREGLLPKQKNRIWYEADINYTSGARGADRIVYSNDGLIYMTTDHYKTFTDITTKGP